MVAQLVFLFLSSAIIRETSTEIEVKTVNVIVKKQIDNNFPWSIEYDNNNNSLLISLSQPKGWIRRKVSDNNRRQYDTKTIK